MILCMVTFAGNSAYSSVAPFYPHEAVEKGVDEKYVGFIFAGYSLAICVFSPIYGRLLDKHGRKKILMIGCFCQSFAMLSFTLLIIVDNAYVFGILSFIIRFTEGFGNGCINCSCNSIIQFDYAHKMSKYITLIQTSTGLGMLSGPLVGSLLYELGGFRLPFATTGTLLSLFGLTVWYKL
jgi:MFS family permease